MKKVVIITGIVLTASATALCFNKAESQSGKKIVANKIEKVQLSNDNTVKMDVSSAD